MRLVLKNLTRRRVRSLQTLVGISLGITTVVAVGVVTAGLEKTATGLVHSGGADFMLAQDGAVDLSFSRLPETAVEDAAAVDGVASAQGALFHITRAGSNAFFFLTGRTTADLEDNPPDLLRGRVPQVPDEVVLGESSMGDLEGRLGGTVEIDYRELRVVGVYTSKVAWERSGAYALLDTVQETVKAFDVVTVVHVAAVDSHTSETVLDLLEALRGERGVTLVVVTHDPRVAGRTDRILEMLDGAIARERRRMDLVDA